MNDKMKKIQKLLDSAEADLHTARSLIREYLELAENKPLDALGKAKDLSVLEEGKIVEGVFNGQNMIGADGKEYSVPANYASKSKLVEGDTLKLTIGDDGSFMYKQIAPIERQKIIGSLSQSDGNYMVTAEGKNYKVLQASVTYYKGLPGDQVTIILPKDHDSSWAAVENIIKKNATEEIASPLDDNLKASNEDQQISIDNNSSSIVEPPVKSDTSVNDNSKITIDNPERPEDRTASVDEVNSEEIKELEI